MSTRSRKRPTSTVVIVVLLAAQAILAVPAFAQEVHHFDVSATSSSAAIASFGEQSGVQILASADTIGSRHLNPVSGDLTTDAAFQKLLAGTGLTAKYVGDRSVALVASTQSGGMAANTPSAPAAASSDAGAKEGKKDSSDSFRVAQVDQGAAGAQVTQGPQGTGPRVQLEEVLVTAQKREERLQDVPVPVTAVSGDTLVQSDQLRIQDYLSRIPGLSLASDGLWGSQSLTIRGITTGPGNNPTVGVIVDDVPFGGTSVNTQSDNIPDIDPGDLARVEVLRGPQGTLYGAASMGGLIKFVTLDPSTAGFSGRIQAGTDSVYNGNELGYSVRGSINVPLNSTLAVRASALAREEPGYIDDPTTGSKGVNKERVHGGRLAALWTPSDVFSMKLSALYQDDKADGSSDVDITALGAAVGFPLPPLGDLQQSRLPGTGGFDKQLQAYSATLTAKLGGAVLTVVTGYNVNDVRAVQDSSYPIGLFFGLPNFGVIGAPAPYHSTTDKISQEIRASIPLTRDIDWVVGVFYTHERNTETVQYEAVDPATNELVSSWGQFVGTGTYTEYAAFTNITFRVTDQFDVQVGGRESQVGGSFEEVDTGSGLYIFGETSPFVTPLEEYKKNAFTYLLTPRFKITPDWMVYLRLASGYRAGGPNNGAAAYGLPTSFGPDKTQNYEIGTKGDFLNHTLSVDASLYYIDWKDIQVQSLDAAAGFGYTINANSAKSQGIELSLQATPLTGLTVSAWVSYDDAVLTEPFPPVSLTYGVAGDRLPTTPKISGNLSIEQRFPLSAAVSGFVGGSFSYTGNRVGIFQGTDPVTGAPSPRQNLPGYAKTDLRAGVQFDAWTIDLFANNVADKRGVITGGIGYNPPFAFLYIQPRTVGISVTRTF